MSEMHQQTQLAQRATLSPGSTEYEMVLRGFNQAQLGPSSQRCIHHLFEAQVSRTPNAIAVEFNGQQMRYAELNQQAEQVAAHLRGLGVGLETLVGISLPRGMQMIIGLLGILKAGAAYVPLDPNYPAARLAYMMEKAQLQYLLCQPGHGLPTTPQLKQIHLAQLDLAQTASAQPAAPVSALLHDKAEQADQVDLATGSNLAYVMFTSGSTGMPKGVMVEHGSVVGLIEFLQSLLSADEMARFLASTSLNFDLSVVEIFVPLASGGCIVLIEQVLDLLQQSLPLSLPVSLLNTVPSALHILCQAQALPSGLQTVISCGEALPQSLVDTLYQQGIRRVYDFYGPTEDTVYSTWVLRRAAGEASIGRAIPDSFAFVLDAALQPVPIGEIGQLYLAGNGLARGYLHDPELSQQSFIANPYASFSGPRLYRTGDMACWNAVGELKFLGRRDQQIKYQGHRIELAEIEAALMQHADIAAAVVIAWPPATLSATASAGIDSLEARAVSHLLAYIVLQQGQGQNSQALSQEKTRSLRQDLAQRLPSYMLPHQFIVLEKLPQTANGKIDRKALPKPDLPEPPSEAHISAWWRSQLHDLPLQHNLPMDAARTGSLCQTNACFQQNLDASLCLQMQSLAMLRACSVLVILHAALTALLARYSGDTEVVIGHCPDLHKPDAYLIWRSALQADPSVGQIFTQSQQVLASAQQQPALSTQQMRAVLAGQAQLLQLSQLSQSSTMSTASTISSNLPEAPVFQIMLQDCSELGEGCAALCCLPRAGIELFLCWHLHAGQASLDWHYASEIFSTDSITRMAQSLPILLEAMLSQEHLRLSQLPLLSAAWQQTLLHTWNQSAHQVPAANCYSGVHLMFEQQAARQAQALALWAGQHSISYGELNHAASALAQLLMSQTPMAQMPIAENALQIEACNLAPGSHIGVCIAHQFELVVAILAIWKAGMVYVPLDVSYPEQRIAYLLQDAQVKLVLTVAEQASRPGLQNCPQYLLEMDALAAINLPAEAYLSPPCTTPTKASVLYTSGSSGEPKGVLGWQHNFVTRLQCLQQAYPLQAGELLCQKTSIGFIDHIPEIFQALCYGAPLLMIPRQQLHDLDALLDLLIAHQVSRMILVPSLLRALLDTGRLAQWQSLNLLISSGEAISLAMAAQFRQAAPQARLLNLYGSSEIGDVLLHQAGPDEAAEAGIARTLPAGKPCANARVYILDQALNVLPVGVVGDLYAAGLSLAAGYWQREELTRQAFIANPYAEASANISAEADACAHDPAAGDTTLAPMLYKTGDKAYWRADGCVQLLGRADHQIKIHGCRVELGEIEQNLLALNRGQPQPLLAGVRVLVDQARAQLIACVLATNLNTQQARQALIAQLRDRLKQSLPSHMQVQQYLILPAFPLLANGKVDQRRLFALAREDAEQAQTPSSTPTAFAARDQAQLALQQIWQQLLGVAALDLDTGFLDLGGDSLRVINMLMQLRRRGWLLASQAVLDNQGIRQLAQLCTPHQIKQAAQNKVAGPDQASSVNQALNLPLFANHHWFLLRADYHHWNASHLYRLDAELDLRCLQQAFAAVLQQHEGLRVLWLKHASGYAQQILPFERLPAWWQQVDLSAVPPAQEGAAISRLCADLQTSLDIHRQMFKLVIFDFGPKRSRRMLFLPHHLLIDAYAYAIVFEDLARAYQHFYKQRQTLSCDAPSLPACTSSLQAWAQAQQHYAQSAALQYLPYWQQAAWQACLPLPQETADNRATLAVDIGLSRLQLQSHALGASVTLALQRYAKRHGLSLPMIMLSSVVASYQQWTGQDHFAVNSVQNGRLVRDIKDIDLSRSVAWLANYSLSLLQLAGLKSASPRALLQAVNQQMQALQDDGMSFSCLKFLNQSPEVQALMQAIPQAQIEFNFSSAQTATYLPNWLQEADEDYGSNDGLMRSGFVPFVKVEWQSAGLVMHWGWCPTRYHAATIQALATHSQAWLQQLLDEELGASANLDLSARNAERACA